MTTLGLVMIVRNEAAVIRRCLESVKPIINHWVICDTGSTDGTKRLIRDTLAGIAGELHETPWVDFGHNRSVALGLAAGKADYHLLIDADMTVNLHAEFRHELSADWYLIRHEGPSDYWVERLVSDRHRWKYLGATHECVYSDTAKTKQKLPELSIVHHEDGASHGEKYQRDIKLLKQDLARNPHDSRAVFYLAQTYRDVGNLPQAMEWYEKRTLMGGWDEEVWYSCYQVARLRHRLGIAWPLVLTMYLEAYRFRSSRLEPLLYIARFYRESEQYPLGFLFSRPLIDTPYPEDILFVEKTVYHYELPLEYAICCSRIGKNQEAIRIFDDLITSADTPESVRQDAEANKLLCHSAMHLASVSPATSA